MSIIVHHCDEAQRTAEDQKREEVQYSLCSKSQGQQGKEK